MGKPIPSKKIRKSLPAKRLVTPPEKANDKSRAWIGVDLSLHTVAIAGLGFDYILDKYQGPSFTVVRWHGDDHYFDRLKKCANAHGMILDVLGQLGAMLVRMDQVYIAIEEPWPLGMEKRGHSQTLKQQAELNGAFMSGLLKYGYTNLYQIHNMWWKKIIADDLGISTHHSKWGKGVEGKMRAKEWALGQAGTKTRASNWGPFHSNNSTFPNEIPVWPDIIADPKGGRMPKPETSKAQPKQPDDRYDSLAMAVWMMNEAH